MRLVLEADPSPELTRTLLAIEKSARRHFNGTLTDSVIGYATLTLFLSRSSFNATELRHGSLSKSTSQSQTRTMIPRLPSYCPSSIIRASPLILSGWRTKKA